MNDKLKDVRSNKHEASEEAKAEHYEAELAEPTNPENEHLNVDPEVVVPTGDEEYPVSGADHKRSLKSIYGKSRNNREALTSREREAHTDVDHVAQLVAEAAGGDVPDAHGEDGTPEIDTNRETRPELRGTPDADGEGGRGEGEEQGEARGDRQVADSSEGEDRDGAPDALSKYDPDDRIEVKVLGETFSVPRQDVDDAGGVEAYQKNRAANIKLQRAATLEKRARDAAYEQSGQQEANLPDTSDGDPAQADSSALREELLDVVANGSEQDIDSWLETKLKSATNQRQRDEARHAAQSVKAEEAPPSETEKELQQLHRQEVEEANRMMAEEYQDIMSDDAKFRWAQQEFKRIAAHPSSRGRTQSEIAREAAETVRSRATGVQKRTQRRDPVEEERQTRIERKRKLPQTSSAAQQQAPNVTTERKVPSAKDHIARLRRRSGQDYSPDR